MSPPNSPFKFDSSHVFLTYPQSTLTAEAIYDHVNSLKPLEWARICQERHRDGGTHQHVVAKFQSRYQTRNQRAFDVAGFHPNIQPVRSIRRALAYVTKDGEFTDFGSVPNTEQEGDDINWVDFASTSSEAEYFAEAMRRRVSYQYALHFWRLGSRTSTEIPVDYEPIIERECATLQETPCPPGTTVLVGPSGVGKTSWAKRVCEKPALWVRHLDVLTSFRPSYHKSIVFDDMSFTHIPREAQIHLVDQQDEAHVHVRYRVAVIPANTQRIFTANNNPFIEDPAIERRVNHIYL